MKYLCELIKYLINITKEKGIKGAISIISILILGVIFISPSYIFIFFYKRSLFLEYSEIINIITIIILDIILFLVLFFICSFRNITLNDDNGNIESNDSDMLADIVTTIFLMGSVSIFLVIINVINIIIKSNSTTKIGVIFLCIILGVIFIIYFIPLVKLYFKSIKIKVVKQLKNKIQF